MRGGAVLGSSVGRLLAFCCAFPGTCHEAETGAKAAGGHRCASCNVPGYTLPRHPIDPLPWGIPGYQW